MSWIITHTGKKIDIENTRPEDIDINDIAFALSHIPRFNGHVGCYSVAQHSVHVAELAPNRLTVAALLHDAAETYIGDLASPNQKTRREYDCYERRSKKEGLPNG